METTWLGQKACLWRAPWPVQVGSHVRRDQQSHPPLGANFLVTFSLVTMKILITWRLTTSSLWAMACWTIRFCRDLWASGFLSHDMMSQVTCHMSSALLYFLPEDTKYVLKKNSLLWKVRILINGSFYCVQVSHDWLTKVLRGNNQAWFAWRNPTVTDWNPVCRVYILYSMTQPSSKWESHRSMFLKMHVAEKKRQMKAPDSLGRLKVTRKDGRAYCRRRVVAKLNLSRQENKFVYFMFK